MNQGYHNQMQQQNTPSQLPAGQQQSPYNPSMQQQTKDITPGQPMGHQSTPTSLQTTTLPPISQVQGSSVSTSNASLLNTSSLTQDSSCGNQGQTVLTQSDSNR